VKKWQNLNKWQKRLISALIIVVVIVPLIANLGLAYFFKSQLDTARETHRPCVAETPQDRGFSEDEFENVTFPSLDGLNLVGFFFPAQNAKATIVISHGAADASCGEFMLPLVRPFVEAGYSVLLITLRNFGESEGDLSSFGRTEWQDIAGAVVWVEARTDTPVYTLGISMGGASVLTAATQGYGDAQVLLVPFVQDVPAITWRASQQTGLPEWLFRIPAELAIQAEWGTGESQEPLAYVNRYGVDIPTLIIGGRNDHILPPEGLVTLQSAIGPNAQLRWTEGRHNLVRENEAVTNQVIQYSLQFFDEQTGN
jgi:alpha-beta hydrolase superfamily lysophospholipase